MPLIQAQEKKVREAVTVKLDKGTVEQLRLYAEFIDSTQEHVVNEALNLTFRKDKEFQDWVESRQGGARDQKPASQSK
jgi:predicted transcriptional regulator